MQYIISILPFLACPLVMGVMMWIMMRGNQGNQGQGMNTMNQDRMPTMAAPRRDSGQIVSSVPPVARTRDEHVAELRSRLSRLQTQQQTITSQLAELDAQEESAARSDA